MGSIQLTGGKAPPCCHADMSCLNAMAAIHVMPRIAPLCLLYVVVMLLSCDLNLLDNLWVAGLEEVVQEWGVLGDLG